MAIFTPVTDLAPGQTNHYDRRTSIVAALKAITRGHQVATIAIQCSVGCLVGKVIAPTVARTETGYAISGQLSTGRPGVFIYHTDGQTPRGEELTSVSSIAVTA